MRGEHSYVSMAFCRPWGSSPHARGTLRHDHATERESGIIPACAGNTRFDGAIVCGRWDHPRMRGEHVALSAGGADQPGSSPHARGTLACISDLPPVPGIIPACAGNTLGCCKRLVLYGDHPRMRGEHSAHEIGYWSRRGSSPHARGTRQGARKGTRPVGIIPACAGNTHPSTWTHCPQWDHPRMRGEHVPHAGAGDHPRMRGEHIE